MRISTQRRLDALSFLVPKVSRVDRLEATVGEKIPEVLRPLVDSSKRSAGAKELFAENRRNADKVISRLTGEISTLQATTPLPDVPTEPLVALSAVNECIMQWGLYRRQYDRWKALLADHKRRFPEGWETEHAEKLAALRYKLEEHKVTQDKLLKNEAELDSTDELQSEVNKLRSEIIPETRAGAALFVDVDAMERCHTCGQVVGSKHKEQMRKTNQSILDGIENKKNEIKEHNEKVTKQIQDIQNKIQEVSSVKVKLRPALAHSRNMVSGIEAEIKALESVKSQTEIVAEPTPPGIGSEEHFRGLGAKWNEYYGALKVYEHIKKTLETNSRLAAQKHTELSALAKTVESLSKFEKACDRLDADLLEEQQQALDLGSYSIEMGDQSPTLVCKDTGVAYESMSTGQQIYAGLAVCRKMQSVVKNGFADFVLVDNADLVSRPLTNVGCQVLEARVTKDQELRLESA